jgi:hypothetical protein
MTATEMGIKFLALINQANNFQITSDEIANWLNTAQYQLFNELYWNKDKVQDPRQPPPYSFQSDAYLNDALQPFLRVFTGNTNTIGYVNNPADSAGRRSVHISAVSVLKNSDCDEAVAISHDSVYIPCSFLRDNELSANRWSVYKQPNWKEGQRPLMNYNPAYNLTTTGVQIYPNVRQYTAEIRYEVHPLKIAIANGATSSFAWEFNLYNGNPQFTLVATDADTEFPVFLHQEIVRRAIQNFALSNPDYAQFAQETAKLKMGE